MPSPTVRDPELSARELGAWRGFLRAHAALIRDLDAELEREHGLPLTSYEVLLFLANARGRRLRMSQLADSVLLSRSGLTRLVDRLEAAGLIARESCPSDARGSFAVLTDAGAKAFRRARATHLAGVRRRFLDHLSAADQEHLAALWERLLTGAET